MKLNHVCVSEIHVTWYHAMGIHPFEPDHTWSEGKTSETCMVRSLTPPHHLFQSAALLLLYYTTWLWRHCQKQPVQRLLRSFSLDASA